MTISNSKGKACDYIDNIRMHETALNLIANSMKTAYLGFEPINTIIALD